MKEASLLARRPRAGGRARAVPRRRSSATATQKLPDAADTADAAHESAGTPPPASGDAPPFHEPVNDPAGHPEFPAPRDGCEETAPPENAGPDQEPVKEADTPPGADEDDEEKLAGMTLREHLVELRTRIFRAAIGIFIGFLICFHFAGTLYTLLAAPLEAVLPSGAFMIFTGLPEGFLVEVRIAFTAALFLTSPFTFYQIWAFVAPGLYAEEKRYILPLAFASAFFFICGALFCYFFVFPVAFEFFMSFSSETRKAAPSVGQFLDFALRMLLAFGLVFELPLFSFFLGRLGILHAAQLRKWRPYAILGCFIVAAVLTPPEVYSQLLMAVPLLLLYELSIVIVAVFGKERKQKEKMTDETGRHDGSRPPKQPG